MPRRFRPQLVVEFIGVPGAGKTRIAAALAQALSVRFDVAFPDRYEYRRWSPSRAEALRLDLRHGFALAGYRLQRLCFDVRRAGRPGTRTVVHSLRNSRFPGLLLERMRRDPRRVWVLDEWLLHRTIEESLRSYDADAAFAEAFAFPPARTLPMTYVCVEVDLAVARERILRDDPAFRWFARDGNAEAIERTLAGWQSRLDGLKAAMRRRGLPCLEVDGTADVESNAQRLAFELANALEAPATRNRCRTK